MLDWARLRKGKQNGAGPASPEKRNEAGIALALGGGAARGWAHIGVLRALDEAGIRINMIAGTSVGALVGGCYLAGRLDELEEFARGLTIRRMFGYFDFSLRGHGILGGMRLDAKLRSHLEDIMLEELPAPMVCVATEIGTGHEFWLSSGHLVTAMRASYALPGVFEPVMCNGRLLIDGAMVNPVPVSVCRAYERHLVVAVNLHYDCFGRSAIIKHRASDAAAPPAPAAGGDKARRLGITSVMVDAFGIIQDRISRSRLAGDPPDLSLQPRLSHIGLSEFHRADEAIRIGYEAARAQLPEIERLHSILG